MHSIAFIGTGPDPDNPVWGESAAMAYRHAEGYDQLERCELVACADLVREHGEAFAERYDIPDDYVYEDYEEMLARHEPTFVSISTPVPTHAPIVIDCVESGHVDAIHCEKPMATTWADCKRMAKVAEEAGVQLTFNHQRRFDAARIRAKELVEDGEIGDLERLEMAGKNVYDFGSHLIDLCNSFVGEQDVAWVMGQIDYREEDVRYGAHNENNAIAHWEYENGVPCLASTGPLSLVGAQHRILGSEGELLLSPDEGAELQLRRDGADWEAIEVGREPSIPAAVEHIVACYESGEQPVISAEGALRSTEVIFAIWESARRRGRIDLPLDIEDNPLEAMVEDGIFTPVPPE